jgi:hypothetical protein
MEEIIKNSQTMAEAITKIYGYDNSRIRKKFKLIVNENNYDISHFTSQPRKYKLITKTCPVCGGEFEHKEDYPRQKVTCSYSCSNTYFRSGINNPNHGKNIITSKSSYRTLCFHYHEKKCIICGEDKIVTVHHYDENHFNNEPSNLVPLCPTHHHYVHSKYKDVIIDKIDKYVYDFNIKKN